MNIRRVVLDVDKAISRPTLLEIARAIDSVAGVRGLNITVTDIDIETVGTDVTIEGENLDVALPRCSVCQQIAEEEIKRSNDFICFSRIQNFVLGWIDTAPCAFRMRQDF